MTLLGSHTITENVELIAQKTRDISAYNDAYKRHRDEWMARDPVEAESWGQDWVVFLKRWKDAIFKVDLAHAAKRQLAKLPDSMIPAETEHEIILHALQKTPGRFQRGDFPDFIDRWGKAGNPAFEIDTRQPTSLDIDLVGFQKADQATKAIEKTSRDSTPYVVAGVAAGIALLLLLRK